MEQLRAVQSAKRNDGDSSRSDIDAICAKNASEASKKLLTQLKTMDKDGVKDLINNPKQPYKKKVLNLQAREKLREQMRKKLKDLGSDGNMSEFPLEPDECIDYEKIPETLIAQIGKTIDMEMEEDMDLSESINETIEDRDIEVVKQNLGQDFLMGSEMLLMNGFSLLAETDNESEMPPLPAEVPDKPPSPPPEPVPPVPDPILLPVDKAVFSSCDRPWSPLRPAINDRWDIESAKNPDPPSFTSFTNPSKTPFSRAVSTPKEDVPVPLEKPTQELKSVNKTSTEVDDEWDKPSAPAAHATDQNQETALPDLAQRANETYGEYRRRLNDSQACSTSTPTGNIQNNNRQQNDFNQAQVRIQQNLKNFNFNNGEKNAGRGNPNGNRNARRNDNRINQNDSRQQNRKSRFDMDRGRDRLGGGFTRNSSRDTNNSYDSGRADRFDEVKDAHNYRFKEEKESDIDRLTSILNPKPLQFRGSFNVRSQNTSGNNQRGNRTPVNNSVERDFDDSLLPLPNDARPCLTTLRKVMEIDAEIAKFHEKIHGIDKVISNLQSERIGYQKSSSSLQHDRKVLFDNLMKRAMTTNESEHQRDQSNSRDSTVVTAPTQKSTIEKKLQNIVNQKKRKHDNQIEEPKKKKQVIDTTETTSAAAKAEQIRKEREEKERHKKVLERKRIRREREEAEKARLEEKIRREAAASTTVTVKQEPSDKSVEKAKSSKSKHSTGKAQRESEESKSSKILINPNEILHGNYELKKLNIQLPRVPLAQNLIDSYLSAGCLNIDIDDWSKWSKPMKPEKIEKTEKPVKAKSPEVRGGDPLVIPESNEDPLAIDDSSMNPLTPGSNLTNDDSMLIEIQTDQDYSEWSGTFTAHDSPIVHLSNVNGKFVVAASEDGKVFKYHLNDGKLAAVFSKHTEICNSFMYDDKGNIYTISTDGFLHKIKFKVRCMGIANGGSSTI